MSDLSSFLNISVISTDGAYFVGMLDGYDHSTNLLLKNVQERILSPDKPGILRELGTYIIRGEMVAVVGLVDEALDESIIWADVRGSNIGTTRHKA